jgi:hypothetical protein
MILLVGANPRHRGAGAERAHAQGLDWLGAEIGLIGAAVELTYSYERISARHAGDALRDAALDNGFVQKLRRRRRRA